MYKHQKSMFSLDIFYIGNAGGYLGLFLGYTLLNVPDFLKDTYNRIIDKYKEIRELKRNRVTEDTQSGEVECKDEEG